MANKREQAAGHDPFARCFHCLPSVLRHRNEIFDGCAVSNCGAECKRRSIALNDVDAEQVISNGSESSVLRLYRGAHLVVSRGLYFHHGIYCGDLKVIHFAGGLVHAGPVEEVSLSEFAQGAHLFIREHPNAVFLGREVIANAAEHLNRRDYSLWNNNCEHFCELVIEDRARSRQVEAVKAAGSVVSMAGQLLWGAAQIVFVRR